MSLPSLLSIDTIVPVNDFLKDRKNQYKLLNKEHISLGKKSGDIIFKFDFQKINKK